MNKEEIAEAIKRVKEWLDDDETWNSALDGYDRIDCCLATLRRLEEELKMSP